MFSFLALNDFLTLLLVFDVRDSLKFDWLNLLLSFREVLDLFVKLLEPFAFSACLLVLWILFLFPRFFGRLAV